MSQDTEREVAEEVKGGHLLVEEEMGLMGWNIEVMVENTEVTGENTEVMVENIEDMEICPFGRSVGTSC